MFLHEVPFHHVEKFVEILFDLFHREFALVDGIKPAFEEGCRQCQVCFVEQQLANVQSEQVVCLAFQIAHDLCIDVLCELLSCFYIAFGESHFEELFVQFRLCETTNLGNGQRKFRIDAFQFRFFNLKNSCALCRVGIEFIYIYLHGITHLLAEERFASSVAHADQTDIGLFDLHLGLIQGNGQCVFGLNTVNIYQLAETTGKVATIAITHFIFDSDRIFFNFILFAQCNVDFGSNTHFECEFVFGVVVEIERLLFVARNHVSDQSQFFLFNIVEATFGSSTVSLFGHNTFAVHLIDDAHGNHTRAESRYVGFAFIGAQGLVHGLVVVGFAHRCFEQGGSVFQILSYDVHFDSLLFIIFYLFRAPFPDKKPPGNKAVDFVRIKGLEPPRHKGTRS